MRLSELMGLPVLGAREGSRCGQVIGWLADGAAMRVACLLVDTGRWYAGAVALPLGAVVGLGRDAVIIDSRESLTLISQSDELMDIADERITLMGAQIFTPTGECLGEVSDAEINERGSIVRLETARGAAVAARRILVMGAVIFASGEEAAPLPAPDSPAARQAAERALQRRERGGGTEIIVPSPDGKPVVIKTPPPPQIE